MAAANNQAIGKAYYWIFSFYIILALIIPTGAVVANLIIRDAYIWSHNWNGAVRIVMFFVTLPIYLIYTFLIIKRHFPKRITRALLLFLPYVFSVIIFYFWSDLKILDFLILNSLPFFLGINSLYFGGLMVLIVKNTVGESFKEIIKRLIGTIIIISLIFFPVVHTLLVAIKFNLEIGGWMLLLGFIFIVITTIISHFPVLKELYKEGRL
jgi:hypothetical protein